MQVSRVSFVYLEGDLNILYFAGVRKIMVTGASVQCSKEALRLTRLYPGMLYSTAGGY